MKFDQATKRAVATLALAIVLGALPVPDARASADRPPMELVAEGAGWRLVDVDPTSADNTMLWEIKRSAIRSVPLSPFQRDIVAEAFADDADFGASDGLDLRSQDTLYFSQEMLQALEDPDFPEGYEHYMDAEGLQGLEREIQASLSICRWRDRSYHKAWSYSKNLDNVSLPFSGTITGGLSANLPISGNIDLTARYKRRECLGIPVGFRFVGTHGTGSATIAGNASLNAAAGFSHVWEREWLLHTIDLGSYSFSVGPVPVRLEFSLPIHAGARLDVAVAGSVNAQIDASATGTFTFTCGTSSCTGTSNFADQFEFTQPTASATLDLGAEAHVRAMVRAALYHDGFLYVEGGAKAYARADLWGYFGNSCGDADGDGSNETVRALAADLSAGYRFAYGWGGVINDQLRYTGGQQYLLGWYDLLGPGGSTALQPMIRGPSTIVQGAPVSYSIEMRPCYKYSQNVTVSAAPGSFTGAMPFPPSGGSTTITGSFPNVGNRILTVTALSDTFGRNLGTAYSRTIHVTSSGPTVPAAPSNLSASVVSSSVQLGWVDNSNNETNFQIHRRLSGGAWAELSTAGANAISHLDTSVVAGTAYQYRIRARNSAGNSAWSNVVSVSTPLGVPAAPSDLTVIHDAGTQRLVATWNDNASNETGFTLEFSYSGSAYSPVSGTLGANATSWTSGSGVPSGTYQFRVRAYNQTGNSAWSNVAFVLAY